MIEIDDLNGTGKMLVGQIPDPDGSISNDDFGGGPLPTSAPSLAVDAEAELFGGFDSSHIGCGIRVADGSSIFIYDGLGEYAAGLALACAGALSLDSAGPALAFGGNDGDLDAVHQHIHLRNVLPGNNRQNELFGATDFPLVPPADLRANTLGGSFDSFGGDFQTRQHLPVRMLARTASRCPPQLPCVLRQVKIPDLRHPSSASAG